MKPTHHPSGGGSDPTIQIHSQPADFNRNISVLCLWFRRVVQSHNAFAELRPFGQTVMSRIKKGMSLRHEIFVVLEYSAMSSILINHQLRAGYAFGHVDAVDGRNHDVIVAIGN